MKKSRYFFRVLVLNFLFFSFCFVSCKKKNENPIVYPQGTFPDTVVSMQDINSQYDDYNLNIYQLTGNSPVIFSSNRKSAGGQFDLEQGNIAFIFDQTSGTFELITSITNDIFLSKLIQQVVTPGNDFGPYRFLSTPQYEFFVISSVSTQGDLNLFYFRNLPYFGGSIPSVEGPYPIDAMNTGTNDAYFCLNATLDTAYFASDRDGSYDIYMQKKPAGKDFTAWFNQGFTAAVKVDSINTLNNDICPMIYKNIMVFASNRQGGLGGYDLYYSVLKKGKWSSPLNLGPRVNTSSAEYRPVIGSHPDFTNYFLMFSSNRPGGKGGFDLYFTGLDLKDI